MKALVAIIAVCAVLLVMFQVKDRTDKHADQSAAETAQVMKILRHNGYLD